MGAARSANKKTGPLGYATYGALRAAMMAPQIVGPAGAMSLSRRLGRAFGSMPFNKKRIDRAIESLRFVLPHADEATRRELALQSYEHLAMLAVDRSEELAKLLATPLAVIVGAHMLPTVSHELASTFS